ncbi:IS110 family transposase [Gordonibacter sp. 28C]|uniref:IS110 family transposase n=1 Tax=Gordonibacter sp. 28C TaxID=2078569 RepID=UPI000DF78A8F|nr:IS110 family transposase [Gordonibacter sp. 28C]RDB58236.1 IS110 family transposase [Gordonibacter sp. 28C]
MDAAREICIGFDVGKATHRACAVSRTTGEVIFNKSLENREGPIDEILRLVGPDTVVVVDQKRNIGALVIERAHAAGVDVAYLPGLSMKRARDLFPGIAKTDEIDAEVIARTAAGMPWCLRPISEDGESGTEIRLLASQRRFTTRSIVQAKNRLRAVLAEADPAFEAQLDLGLGWQVGVFKELGGPAGIASVSRRRYDGLAKRYGAPLRAASAFRDAALASAASERLHTRAEDMLVRMLAERIGEDERRAALVEERMGCLMESDKTYRALLTIPGIGPKTASALVAGVDIDLFANHGKLASFAGLAPCNKQSGTSLDSSSPSKGGNKELKNLLIFSCNSLVDTKNEFGRYYDACLARGMRHNKALKAVARKRLKVIFAVMRDIRPYSPS